LIDAEDGATAVSRLNPPINYDAPFVSECPVNKEKSFSGDESDDPGSKHRPLFPKSEAEGSREPGHQHGCGWLGIDCGQLIRSPCWAGAAGFEDHEAAVLDSGKWCYRNINATEAHGGSFFSPLLRTLLVEAPRLLRNSQFFYFSCARVVSPCGNTGLQIERLFSDVARSDEKCPIILSDGESGTVRLETSIGLWLSLARDCLEMFKSEYTPANLNVERLGG
jgi:hypothetical protein